MLTEEEKEQLRESDKYWFEELFYRDLESWFSSSIACCDNCYDDFLKVWPHAYYADNNEFQCNSISLECFYSGSRLSEVYTEEEFFRFIKLIDCPRCSSELSYNIWAYELPFQVVDGFEGKIHEITKTIQQTPFLLLKNDFANDVLDALIQLAKETELVYLESSLYRARVASQVDTVNESAFDFAPANFVSEGRYNHAGMPVLYLGSDKETCYQEVREQPCYIAELKINTKVKILDLTNGYNCDHELGDLLSTLVYSSLLSAKQQGLGLYRPEYIFSRFISDCAKFSGFDAIKYPSTRVSSDNYNIVILNTNISISNGIKLKEIIEYKFV